MDQTIVWVERVERLTGAMAEANRALSSVVAHLIETGAEQDDPACADVLETSEQLTAATVAVERLGNRMLGR